MASWPADTPVAYWDAADVVFQDRIAPLWDLVRAHPDQLLAVTECHPVPRKHDLPEVDRDDLDPEARDRAIGLFKEARQSTPGSRPGLPGPCSATYRGRQAPELAGDDGTGDWGDQTAMNLYCRSNPDTWVEIPSGWNYCLVGLPPGHFRVSPDGRTERLDGEPLHAAHGAGGYFKPWDLVHLTA